MKKNNESSECLICNSDKQTTYLKVPNRFNFKETFQLVRCEDCNFVFLSPRPDQSEIVVYYEDEDYQPHQQKAASVAGKIYQWIRIRNNRYKRKTIEKLVSKGSILDYGCGTGEFLQEMKLAGWESWGFEPSAKARQVASRYGIQLIDNLQQLEKMANIITLWHVLEHIHQPDPLLQELKKHLDPSGFLLIAVPNHQSVDAKMFRENWVAYDAPRHLYHFQPANMEKYLSKHGFEIIDYRRLNFDPWYNALLSAGLQSRGNKLWLFSVGIFKCFLAAFFSALLGLINVKKHASIIYIARPTV